MERPSGSTPWAPVRGMGAGDVCGAAALGGLGYAFEYEDGKRVCYQGEPACTPKTLERMRRPRCRAGTRLRAVGADGGPGNFVLEGALACGRPLIDADENSQGVGKGARISVVRQTAGTSAHPYRMDGDSSSRRSRRRVRRAIAIGIDDEGGECSDDKTGGQCESPSTSDMNSDAAACFVTPMKRGVSEVSQGVVRNRSLLGSVGNIVPSHPSAAPPIPPSSLRRVASGTAAHVRECSGPSTTAAVYGNGGTETGSFIARRALGNPTESFDAAGVGVSATFGSPMLVCAKRDLNLSACKPSPGLSAPLSKLGLENPSFSSSSAPDAADGQKTMRIL